MRERRTVTVDFGLSIAEYTAAQSDTAIFIERVTATMRVVTHVEHKEGCCGEHRYTRHSTYGRFLHGKGAGRARIPISQIRCLDCSAVFTVLPSFVMRYQRYDVRLAQPLLEYYLIMNVCYSFQARMLQEINPELGTFATPMALWRLMQWLGNAIPVTDLLLKLGLKPPTAFIEDEKFVSEGGHQTYIAAISNGDVIWWTAYLQATDEASLTTAFESFRVSSQRCFPRYVPRLALTDGHLPAQAALCNTFTSISIQECLLHIQRKVNTDLATYRRKHPEATETFLESTSTRIWDALTTSTSVSEFSQRLRRVRESLKGDPLMTGRINKVMAKRDRLTEHLHRRGVPTTSVEMDQKFKWLNRKYFQMQSLMSEVGGRAFANAWAIARDFWHFMRGSKRAGRSPVEIAGLNLSGHPWLEVVNLCAYGAFQQA
jgi:hypothetical protein